jgi:hypothetical protein
LRNSLVLGRSDGVFRARSFLSRIYGIKDIITYRADPPKEAT